MHPTCVFNKDESNKTENQKVYIGIIVSLFYLIASIPDILFSICLCDTLQPCPRKSYILVVKRIFRY